MAQEILSTFVDEIGSLTLVPSCLAGFFQIKLDGEILWDRKEDGGFPDVKSLKQRIRDRIVPERDLGHIDS
jgi:selenoprotein W-related protein